MKLNIAEAILKAIAAVLEADANINEQERKLLSENLSYVYNFSKHNDMAHLVGFALEKEGIVSEEDEQFSAFQKEQYLSVFRQENQDYELERVCNALENAKIDFIPLKGAVMRAFYPEPWMRTSCDIDILVKKEDFTDAKKCMLEDLGYKQGKQSLHDESFDSQGGVHIELHFDLLEEDETDDARRILEDVWICTENAEDKIHHKLMSDEMFYFYHIAHIAKHFSESGIGIRPFIDLYLLDRNEDNEEKRKALLEAGGLLQFASVARKLAAHWFSNGELDSLTARAEIFVFNCGTYGSEENRILLAKEKEGGGVKYVLSRIFMPYDSIKYSYPILQKHKWLMPFCQIARWFKLISPRQARSAAQEIKTSKALSDRDLKKLKLLLYDIGLKKGVVAFSAEQKQKK